MKLAVGEAGQRRLFFEKQLKLAKDDLTQAEAVLASYQRQKGIVSPQGQAGLTISAAAGLRAQIAAKEVQIQALKTFATEDNPDLVRAQEELAGLRVQLARVSKGDAGEVGDVLMAVGKAPQEGMEYLRRFRDVKYYETLFELLAKQYEIARIDEARDATLIQVMDRAVAPEKKSKPWRLLIAVLTALAGVFVAMLWIFVAEALEIAKRNPEQSLQLQRFRSYLSW